MGRRENGSDFSLFPLSRKTFLRVKRIQAAAGLWFASFVGVHLLNAAAVFAGPETRDAVLRGVRTVTGTLAGEILWIACPVCLHLGTGVLALLHEAALKRRARRLLKERHPGREPSPRGRVLSARLHRWTGLCLPVFLGAHVLLMRGLSFSAIGYDRIPLLFEQQPVLLSLSMGGLLLCAAYHVPYGLWMGLVNLKILGPGAPRRWGWRLAVVTMGAILLTGGLALFHLLA